MSETVTKRSVPVFIVKKDTISAKDIRRMELMAQICVVESTEPESARLLEPPVDADVPAQARAALNVFRYIKDTGHNHTVFARGDLVKYFVDLLMHNPQPESVKKVKTR